MRLSATKSIMERPDVRDRGLGLVHLRYRRPRRYHSMILHLREGEGWIARDAIKRLTEMQYTPQRLDFARGVFRVRGDVLDIFPAENAETRCASRSSTTSRAVAVVRPAHRAPSSRRSGVSPCSLALRRAAPKKVLKAVDKDQGSSCAQKQFFIDQMKLIEAQRIEQRTRFDLEMLRDRLCRGIENYSRYLSRAPPGEPPPTLIDHPAQNALMFVDESHVTIPQVGGMYNGDRSRKENLVSTTASGCPSALDNRPLKFEEFE